MSDTIEAALNPPEPVCKNCGKSKATHLSGAYNELRCKNMVWEIVSDPKPDQQRDWNWTRKR